jgi:hypothetical protein
LLEKDLERACKLLDEIETDLVFEVIESYRERRLEEFGDALLLTNYITDLRDKLCGKLMP